MKVLLVSGSLPPLPCGVGDYTLQLAQALAANPNIQMGVLTSTGASPPTSPLVEVFPLMDDWGIKTISKFKSAIKTWNPDIIHIQYPTQGYGFGLLPPLIPMIANWEGIGVVRTWHEIPSIFGAANFVLEALPPGPFVVVRPEFENGLPPPLRRLIARRPGGYVMGASAIPRSNASEAHICALRERLLEGKRRLVVFFGFLYPFKRVELLFEICDPDEDHIVIAGEAGAHPKYRDEIERAARGERWRGSATIMGFLPAPETAELLAAADAVILPFQKGGGVWNSSIHAAMIQGTAVVTTSISEQGLDHRRNIYYAKPDDVDEMRMALNKMAGQKRPFDEHIDEDDWTRIARRHIEIYRTLPVRK